MPSRTVKRFIVLLCVPALFLPGHACLGQNDKNNNQDPTNNVKFELRLATPIFISGMKLFIEGKVKNQTNEDIRIVPPDKWSQVGAWEDLRVSLHSLLAPWQHVGEAKPNDFTLQIGPGRDYVFKFLVDESIRYFSKDEKTATVAMTLLYQQGEQLKKVSGKTEFSVTDYGQVMLAEKERVTKSSPETKAMYSRPLKVKVGKICVSGKYWLVSRCMKEIDGQWTAFATGIIDEVGKETDLVLGTLPDLRVRLCYERGEAVVETTLSAWTGDPEKDDREQKQSEK
jgi:hypothetical protein